MLTEKQVIVFRWREYFGELLNCPTTGKKKALEKYPIQEDMANPPALEDILAVIKRTTTTVQRCFDTCNMQKG